MKNSILMLALVLVGFNADAVKRQVTRSAAEDSAIVAAEASEAKKIAQMMDDARVERLNESSRKKSSEQQRKPTQAPKARTQETTQTSEAPAQETPKAQSTSQSQQQEAPQAQKENVTPQTESASNSSTAQSQETAKEQKEPMVEAQSNSVTQLLGNGLKIAGLTSVAVSSVGGLAILLCKAYVAANPIVYPAYTVYPWLSWVVQI